MKPIDKDTRIKREIRKLRALFKDLPKDRMTSIDALISRAAFMKITLEDFEADIDEHGYTEPFTQSAHTPPYERQRPVVQLYNSMTKNYQSAMKQLYDLLPEGSKGNASDDFLKFSLGGKT